jgi:diguanylate cyclase (GGDEF)-like protein/PAS domain S-box-containing protein
MVEQTISLSRYSLGPDDEALHASEQTIRILIVDDEPRLCQSLKELLELHGYQCTPAIGGQEAISFLDKQRYDVLLLDIKMPDIDGHQVMDHIKSNRLSVDVIVVSGETTFDEATWALQHGAHDFLRKPYVSGELLRSIDNVIKKRRLEAENRRIQNRLRDSEQRHRYFVDNSPDIVYMLDREGRFSFVNRKATALLGYSREELIGKHYSDVVYQDDLEKVQFAFPEHRTGKRASHDVELRLVRKDGEPTTPAPSSGTVTVELNAMGVYSGREIDKENDFLGTYGVIRDISERKAAEEIITYQLYHDLLTKLPNRVLFKDRLDIALSHAKRGGSMLAVMYLDLDGFKIINDSLGHLAGDELLQAVAIRIHNCLRESDTLARVGGDEFNLLLPEIKRREDAAKIARKIIETLKAPFILEGQEIFISVSIGIALHPDDGQDMDALIRNSDIAMYHIKGRGKNGFEFFNSSMTAKVTSPFTLESGLRRALDENQFNLLFQPQQKIDSGQIVGVEALLRWNHPDEGLLSPTQFIPLAEETGVISEIGEWVLRAACRELAQWRKNGLTSLRMAVNLSAVQLYRVDFVDTVLDILDANRIPGDCLELEITENVLMQDMEHVVKKLDLLAAKGIGIAVDDFGTGYSSLGYLQSLPLSTLKIDRSFVQDIQSSKEKNSIISAIVAMAKGLNLNLTAEGVETEAQLNYLRSIGCPLAQGYLISPPLTSPETIDRFIKND